MRYGNPDSRDFLFYYEFYFKNDKNFYSYSLTVLHYILQVPEIIYLYIHVLNIIIYI